MHHRTPSDTINEYSNHKPLEERLSVDTLLHIAISIDVDPLLPEFKIVPGPSGKIVSRRQDQVREVLIHVRSYAIR